METISYVIRTKNEGKNLEKTCKLIRKQEKKYKHEIVIVDSGSTDDTLSIAKRYADLIIEISPDSFTWGYALNIGVEKTKGEIVCLISGHCFVKTNKSIELAYEYLRDSGYACLYGRQVGNKYLDKAEAIEMTIDFPREIVDSDERTHIPGISNACCMIKKTVWQVAKFDEKAQSAEDGIWYSEIVSLGYKAVYNPVLCVIHGHPFNAEYQYKKWYWRIYKYEEILGRSENLLKSNQLRFLISFLRGMTIKCLKFYFAGKKNHIAISYKAALKYYFIKEFATLKAKNDLKNGVNGNIQYEMLAIPFVIRRLSLGIRNGELYDIQS